MFVLILALVLIVDVACVQSKRGSKKGRDDTATIRVCKKRADRLVVPTNSSPPPPPWKKLLIQRSKLAVTPEIQNDVDLISSIAMHRNVRGHTHAHVICRKVI